MSKPILFYSRKSNECISLWKNLDQKNRLSEFIKICVDNNNKIPPMITSVPSIFIKGRPVISGAAIQMYLSNPNTSQNSGAKSRPNFQAAPNQNLVQDSRPEVNTSTNNLGGILDFNAVEMGNSFSDSYSFIQDNPSPMDFCYQFIKDEKDNAITNHGSKSNVTNNSSRRSSGIDKRLAELQKQRNNF